MYASARAQEFPYQFATQVFLLIVVFTTHTTAMYVMEAVTTAGLLNHFGIQARCGDGPTQTTSGSSAHQGQIQWPTQISQVNTALLPTAWRIIWFFILIVYLYPDLAVYSVFISDTVQVVFPVVDFAPELFISGDGVYYTALVLSSVFLTPWVFGSFKGTTALQVTTTITRNVLLWSMIIIAVCMLTGTDFGQLETRVESNSTGNGTVAYNTTAVLSQGFVHSHILSHHQQAAAWHERSSNLNAGRSFARPSATVTSKNAAASQGKQAAHTPASSGHGHRGALPWANFSKVPLLFGGIVYSTIHQQYAPSILSPLRNKPKNLLRTHRSVLCGVTIYYLALCLTAVAAFAKYTGIGDAAVAAAGGESTQCNALTAHPCQLQALYTFNFGFVQPAWFARFIAMAPLLSMLSNFPLIAMTLRDNLMILVATLLQHFARSSSPGPADSSIRRQTPQGGYRRVAVSDNASSNTQAVHARTTEPGMQTNPSFATSAPSAVLVGPTVSSGRTAAQCIVHPLHGDGVPLVAPPLQEATGHRLQLGNETVPMPPAGGAQSPRIDVVVSRGSTEAPAATWSEWAIQTARLLSNPTEAPFESRVAFALLAVVPAYISAALTQDIDFLLRIVGCFGGSFIAFVMPCVLLQYAREAQQVRMEPTEGTSGAGAFNKDSLGFSSAERRLGTRSELFQAPNGGPYWRAAILSFAAVAFVVNVYSLFTSP